MRIMIALLLMITSVMANANEPSVLIFVSFSMPKESLKQWLKEADIIHAPVVIRGLINNSFRETTKTMLYFVKDSRNGVQLDPTLFTRFSIKQVPAVVVTKTPICLSTQSCQQIFDVIYGDVTLDYALQQIANTQDELSPLAEKTLQQIRIANHG